MKTFENDKFKINYSESLEYIIDSIKDTTDEKLDFYYKLFGINTYRKIVINLYDDREEFRSVVLSGREDKNSLPKYAGGVFDDGIIYHYISPNNNKGDFFYKKQSHTISHELWHVLYQELIYKNNRDRIVWYDEGMAIFLSGEMFELNNPDTFKIFFLKAIQYVNPKLNMNEISHNNGFVTNDYNGYDLSYIIIRYLFETKTEEEFRELINDVDKVRSIGETILEEAINYFRKQIGNVKDTENACYTYSDTDEGLISEVDNYCSGLLPSIYDFFGIKEELKKPVIAIVQNKTKFDDIYKSYHPDCMEVPKWLRGYSFNGMIIELSLNDYENYNYNGGYPSIEIALEDFKKCIVHEYVHFIISELSNGKRANRVLNEGIAQILSEQKNNINMSFNYTLDQLFSTNCYDGWYLVTKYILDIYGKEYLLELLFDNERAKSEITDMLDEIKEYYDNEKKYKIG